MIVPLNASDYHVLGDMLVCVSCVILRHTHTYIYENMRGVQQDGVAGPDETKYILQFMFFVDTLEMYFACTWKCTYTVHLQRIHEGRKKCKYSVGKPKFISKCSRKLQREVFVVHTGIVAGTSSCTYIWYVLCSYFDNVLCMYMKMYIPSQFSKYRRRTAQMNVHRLCTCKMYPTNCTQNMYRNNIQKQCTYYMYNIIVHKQCTFRMRKKKG